MLCLRGRHCEACWNCQQQPSHPDLVSSRCRSGVSRSGCIAHACCMGSWADFESFLSDLRTRLLTYLWLLWTSMDSLVEPEDVRDPVTQPPWGQIGRNFTLGIVSMAGKFVLQVCNSLDVKGHSRLTQLVMHRPPGTGLITVSNHAR